MALNCYFNGVKWWWSNGVGIFRHTHLEWKQGGPLLFGRPTSDGVGENLISWRGTSPSEKYHENQPVPGCFFHNLKFSLELRGRKWIRWPPSERTLWLGYVPELFFRDYEQQLFLPSTSTQSERLQQSVIVHLQSTLTHCVISRHDLLRKATSIQGDRRQSRKERLRLGRLLQ